MAGDEGLRRQLNVGKISYATLLIGCATLFRTYIVIIDYEKPVHHALVQLPNKDNHQVDVTDDTQAIAEALA